MKCYIALNINELDLYESHKQTKNRTSIFAEQVAKEYIPHN